MPARLTAKQRRAAFAVHANANYDETLALIPGREPCCYCGGAVVPSQAGCLVTADRIWMHLRCYEAAEGMEPEKIS